MGTVHHTLAVSLAGTHNCFIRGDIEPDHRAVCGPVDRGPVDRGSVDCSTDRVI